MRLKQDAKFLAYKFTKIWEFSSFADHIRALTENFVIKFAGTTKAIFRPSRKVAVPTEGCAKFA